MDRKKRPSGTTSSEDTILVQFVTKGVSKDSPEFQASANRPASERGPSLAQYREFVREQQKTDREQPPSG